jgi:glycosyltransferase involved in cell wall biosynthesis
MNVLVVHNRYREAGGEDRVVELETALLHRNGHKVVPYLLDNAAVERMNPVMLAGRTVWSHRSYKDVSRLIAQEQIDLVHVHNTLPLASPSVYHACAPAGIPTVHTLHNYRLLCPNGVLVRDDRPCVSCVGAAPFPAVRHACYRGSRAASGAVAAMLLVHRALGTWDRKVATFIAPTEFVRGIFVAGGVPGDRIQVKPHFVYPDPGVGTGRGGYALYVGRLSPEKGIATLLDGWARLRQPVPLKIVGDGPLAPSVVAAAARLESVTYLGQRSRSDVQALMADAALLVLPSIFYETFGQVVIEAYAAGTPVLTTAGGAAAELVSPGRTGALTRSGDAAHLASMVDQLFSSEATLTSMRGAARAAYEARFTAETNYQQLMAIYREARARVARGVEHAVRGSVRDSAAAPDEARS